MQESDAKPISQIFEFCPRCGQQGGTGENPFVCGKCQFTQYFSPVTAVGGIIQNADSEVLLLTRAKDPGRGKYGLPGGFVDAGETLEEALAREVLEETNLTVTRMSYLTSFPNDYAFKGVSFPVTDAFFVCDVDSMESIACQESEIARFDFLRPTDRDLNHLAFESNRKALHEYLSRSRHGN